MRHCNKCETDKPETEFYSRTTGALHHECKTCYRARVTARVHGPNKERIRIASNANMKGVRSRLRDAAFAAYGGYKCVCCGENEPKFMTLDHINNDGAKFRREKLGSRTKAGVHTYKWLAKRAYPQGLQVLCMNCNHGKRMNNGICPHMERCNDQSKDVGTSVPKHSAPELKLVSG